jgi:hypothetical protein
MSGDAFSLTADEVQKHYLNLKGELDALVKLNNSDSRTLESIAAQQHGGQLLQLLFAARLEILQYNDIINGLNKNGRK